ncbi:MAG: hypothetical protein U1F71_08860 [Verrucomicrobiaceae bacterium]
MDPSPGPDESTSSQERRAVELFKTRPMLAGFGASVVMVLGIWLCWSPVAQAMKAARGRSYAKTAIEALQKQDWVLAFRSVADARRWAPLDEQVLLATIQVLDATKADPAALVQSLQTLDTLHPLTDEQNLMLARTLIVVGKPKEARDAISRLGPVAQNSATALEVQAALLKAEGHDKSARRVSNLALHASDGSPEARLQLAVQQRSSPFVEVQSQALEEVWRIAREPSEAALPAIRRLAGEPSLTLAQARTLLDLIENHPHQNAADRLTVVSALMRLQPDQRQVMLENEIRLFKDNGNAKLEVFALWLAREKAYERLVQLVPLRLAINSRELFPVIAQALAEQQLWSELDQMFASEHPPISKARLAVGTALVKSHLSPGSSEVRRNLEAGINAATRDQDADTLENAAALAQRLFFTDLAVNAYLAIAEFDDNRAVAALQRAYNEAALLKDAGQLLEIARKLHDVRPTSSVFTRRLSYLRLVMGEEIEVVSMAPEKGAVESSQPSSPDLLPLPLLRSLAAFRVSNRSAMITSLSQLQDTTSLPPGPRAVAAGLLALAGQAGPAYQIAEKVPDGLLLQEELTFLKHAR